MGITEGTAGRNINEVDFPHLRELKQAAIHQKELPSWEESGPPLPPFSHSEHQISKSQLTLPVQICSFTVGNSTTNGASCCHTPWENFFAKQKKILLWVTVPQACKVVSVLPQLFWDKFKFGRQITGILGLNINPNISPWFFLCSFNSRTMLPLAIWPGKHSIKHRSFTI